ncbi:hypothetical protein D0869_02832 [Hortaea werneckii]|uniref:Phosphotransferase n=1 Tax=Hortaea werneckii TaxID=91943 RepID=A0A3M6X8I7_HORWE|nr:hypothetical protein D0869_02832 [Hortaea werneckii]
MLWRTAGERPASWHEAAQHVLVNTELSMFGKTIMATIRWDDELNAKHILPDFQPPDYLVTGRYLGEMLRLIIVEAVTPAGLFGGELPRKLDEPYALETRLLAEFQSGASASLANARSAFVQARPLRSRPRKEELEFMRDISKLIAERAVVYLATALSALWAVRIVSKGVSIDEASHVTIACNGTIVEKYPNFRACCQGYLDELCERSASLLSLDASLARDTMRTRSDRGH